LLNVADTQRNNKKRNVRQRWGSEKEFSPKGVQMFRNVYNKKVEIRRDLPDGRSAKLQLNRLRYEKNFKKVIDFNIK
ncbi:hypothetical protein, partial [Bacillus atrophaeus]|uniref:hypothetical protein n=1 Tax=Bacillus atrophaeus TaxID=1452 RepID=UPI002283217C